MVPILFISGRKLGDQTILSVIYMVNIVPIELLEEYSVYKPCNELLAGMFPMWYTHKYANDKN